MANRVVDGFDWFPTGQTSTVRAALLSANKFFVDSLGGSMVPDVTTGRFNFGQGLYWNGTWAGVFPARSGYVIPLGVTVTQGYQGFALYRDPTCDATVRALAGAIDGPNGAQIMVTFERFGVIRVYRDWVWNNLGSGSPTGVLLASSVAGAFTEGEWCHVEIFYHTASSGGGVEVRINTDPKIQLVGANTDKTGTGTFDSCYVGFYGSAGGISAPVKFIVDDMYVNDNSGTTMNTWSGNLRVKGEFVIANGATDNFTIGGSSPAATNWQSVLNQGMDDTKYVYSANVGDIDLYTPNPTVNAPYVRVLQVRMGLRQDDATQRVARAVIRISGTNYVNSVDQFTNQTYTFYFGKWELSPATGVSFTGTEVNGLQAGIKVQA